MKWAIYVLAIVGFLSLVGTVGLLFAAWAFHEEPDEDAHLPTPEKNLGRSPTANTPQGVGSDATASMTNGAAANREDAGEFSGVGI